MKIDNEILVLKCLGYFIENPYDKIYLREFSRKMKISPNSAQRFLNLFLREGFILEERIANLRYFKSNIDSIVFRQIKKTFFVKRIIDSGLVGALGKVSSSIVLFGSCAKGLNDNSSDIDLVIISKEKKKVIEIVSKFQKNFSQEISAYVFKSLEWKKQKINNKAFYQDVISEGIVLFGDGLI
jgi:predicted nucleotidyltransferase